MSTLSLNIQTATSLLETSGNEKTQLRPPIIKRLVIRLTKLRLEKIGNAQQKKIKTPIGLISYRGYFYFYTFTF